MQSDLQQNSSQPKRILCVGMCVLDIIHVCEQFPVEDTDKRCLSGYWQRGGNASNNCTVLRQLGAECEFLGMLSGSPAFGFLLADCRERGIAIEHCPSAAQDPPFSSVILTQATGTRTIIHSNPSFPILQYEHFQRLNLSEYSWMHFEARNPDETLRMLRDIRAHNEQHAAAIRISVELEKLRMENMVLAEWADIVFLGKDLSQHMGWQTSREAVEGLRKMLKPQKEFGAANNPIIICTWGADGSSCLDAHDRYTLLPAVPPTSVVDSLGAGDTFCAATIYALLRLQMDLATAVAFGNRCASFKLAHRGYDAIGNFEKY